jgi:signal peptidase I
MTAQDVTAPEAKAGGGFKREAVEIFKTVGLALLIATVLRVFIFEPFTIPSSSMEPGLVTGDYIVISKWSYGFSRASIPFNLNLFPWSHGQRILGRDPERGDVVVFHRPADPDETVIKRLIGLPGDRIQVVKGVVVVNGQAIPRESAGLTQDHDDPGRIVPRVLETAPNGRRYITYGGAPDGEADNTGVYLAPAGTYFFMGDNRDNSLDSRWPREIGMGFVPAENVVGKAQMVMLSWRNASILKPWTWFNVDFSRFLQRVK